MRRELLLGLVLLLGAARPTPARSALLEPRPLTHDSWAESFTFLADLDGGAYLWVQLSFSHMGPGSHHGLCRALLVRPGSRAWAPSDRVGKSGWRYNPGRAELTVGPCRAREGERPEVEAGFEDGRLSLRFERPLSPFQPPGGELHPGPEQHYRNEVLLAHAPVTLHVLRPGSPPLVLGGAGYVDHSISTVGGERLARRWVRFRALREAPQTLLVGREAPDGTRSPVYRWEEGRGSTPLEDFDLQRLGEGKAPLWTAHFHGAGGESARVRATGLLYRSAPVEEYGALGALLRPVLGSPVTYTLRAVLERPGHVPLEGLMEVSLGSE